MYLCAYVVQIIFMNSIAKSYAEYLIYMRVRILSEQHRHIGT